MSLELRQKKVSSSETRGYSGVPTGFGKDSKKNYTLSWSLNYLRKWSIFKNLKNMGFGGLLDWDGLGPRGRTKEESTRIGKFKNLLPIEEASAELGYQAFELVKKSPKILVLGGGSKVALGSFARVLRFLPGDCKILSLIWINPRPDANIPEACPTSKAQGRSLAVLAGFDHSKTTGLLGALPYCLLGAPIVFSLFFGTWQGNQTV